MGVNVSENHSSRWWKFIIFSGIPKNKIIKGLEDFRWLALTATLQRLYGNVLRFGYLSNSKLMKPITYSYGFVPKARVSDLAGILFEGFWLAGEWRTFPLSTIAGDILTAFDRARHTALTLGALEKGATPQQA